MQRRTCWMRQSGRRLATLLLLGTVAIGCEEPSHCRRPCERVAMCKTKAIEGEPILGEKPPPPDKACLKKCRDYPEDFAKCEGKQRLCSQLRACRGAWRE